MRETRASISIVKCSTYFPGLEVCSDAFHSSGASLGEVYIIRNTVMCYFLLRAAVQFRRTLIGETFVVSVSLALVMNRRPSRLIS